MSGKNFTSLFNSEFYNKLLSPNNGNPVRNRADSLRVVFNKLDEKLNEYGSKPFVVETGTLRPDHGYLCFGDDGASTYILDKFVNYYDGELLSVDINEKNVNYCKSVVSEKTKVFCSDSVSFLKKLNCSKKIDFLYLDSFDIDKNNPHPSQLHHLKELCASIDKLNKGSIICVDDHDAFFTNGKIGKANYVKSFMEDIGAKLLYEGYQIVWELGV
jgi:hypothetical protein